MVIPSTLEPGAYPLTVRLQSPLPRWAEAEPPAAEEVTLTTVTIGE